MRLYEKADRCTSDETVFTCINEDGAAIFWEISKRSSGVHFNFNANFDNIGTVINDMVTTSSLRAELLSGNSSFIITSLTITQPLKLNSYTINCNEKIVVLNTTDNSE